MMETSRQYEADVIYFGNGVRLVKEPSGSGLTGYTKWVIHIPWCWQVTDTRNKEWAYLTSYDPPEQRAVHLGEVVSIEVQADDVMKNKWQFDNCVVVEATPYWTLMEVQPTEPIITYKVLPTDHKLEVIKRGVWARYTGVITGPSKVWHYYIDGVSVCKQHLEIPTHMSTLKAEKLSADCGGSACLGCLAWTNEKAGSLL